MTDTWQHTTVEFPIHYGMLGSYEFDGQNMSKTCDAHSQEGWELVSTFVVGMSAQPGVTQKVVAVFRRRKS